MIPFYQLINRSLQSSPRSHLEIGESLLGMAIGHGALRINRLLGGQKREMSLMGNPFLI